MGIIDFGEAGYGDVTKEFSRNIRDYPDYSEHIISAYEEASGAKLTYERLVSYALLAGCIDIAEDYQKGGVDREQAEIAIATYQKLLRGHLL